MSQPLPPGSGPSKAETMRRGVESHRAGRLDQAEIAYRQVLAIDAADADALHLLGVIAFQVERPEIAVDYIGRAIGLQPDRAPYYSNAALVLNALDRLAEAEEACRTALRLQPSYAEAQNNLGLVLRSAGRLDEAVACFRDALLQHPTFPEALNNLGNALMLLRRFDEAEPCLRDALRLSQGTVRPNEIRYNLAQLLLATGQFEQGWQHYESRPSLYKNPRQPWAPLWDGRPTGDRVLLLHAEQGLGDTLQFCRYAPLVAAAGTALVLEVQPPLRRLLAGLPGVAAVVADDAALPPHDWEFPLMSLPRLLGTTLDTVPRSIPYLTADPQRRLAWRRRLAALGGAAKIGLVWAGARYRPETPGLAAMDRRRSITLAQMAGFAEIDGVCFVSLQKGPSTDQAKHPPDGMILYDFTDELADFADTAALVDELDLVISVDTSVVHLAGALGKPVWVLNRFDACWRWLDGRDDSPWYPTLRLFSQPEAGDWPSVVASVKAALGGWVAARG